MTNGGEGVKKFEAAIRALEAKRNSRIFSIIHGRGEHHLCTDDYVCLARDRERFTGIDTLEVLIHSPGGHAHMAYRLARFFRAHSKHLNMIVPVMAKSAATLLCLAADEIYMGEFAELGPLDVQLPDELEREYFSPLDEFKAMEFLREYAVEFLDYFSLYYENRGMSVSKALHEAVPGVIGIMSPLYGKIDPSKVGEYRRALAEGEDYARRLLEGHPRVESVVQRLVWEYPSHDFVIDYTEARDLELPVKLLSIDQEIEFVEAMREIAEDGLHYTGFVPEPTVTKRSGARATRQNGKKLPETVPVDQARAQRPNSGGSKIPV